jgi:hypothetical protein
MPKTIAPKLEVENRGVAGLLDLEIFWRYDELFGGCEQICLSEGTN